MPQQWISEILTHINNNLDEEKLRLIIKSTSKVHYQHLKMDELLAPYIGKLDDFITFIEKEWGWKIHFEDGNQKILIANENKSYCVCPLINFQSTKRHPALCFCSEGFAEQMFATVCQCKVQATVISSVQRRDAQCIYKIELNHDL